jgi:Fungal cellulose binding domain
MHDLYYRSTTCSRGRPGRSTQQMPMAMGALTATIAFCTELSRAHVHLCITCTRTLHLTCYCAECSLIYGQCGGHGWKGPKCCIKGSHCKSMGPKHPGVKHSDVPLERCMPHSGKKIKSAHLFAAMHMAMLQHQCCVGQQPDPL